MLVRRKWLILAAVAFTTALTAWFTYRQIPVYQASVVLRIQEKQVNLPEVFLGRGSTISTEITVLSSRALAEDAAERVGARVRLVSPERVWRSRIIAEAQVAPDAPVGTYHLLRTPEGGYLVSDASTRAMVAAVQPGAPLAFAGVRLRLQPEAASFPEVVLSVLSLEAAGASIQSALAVTQPARDANIVRLDYAGIDPDMVRRVANTVASRYIERRQDAFKAEARNSARFLSEQVARVGEELAAVEDSFRRFREQAQVIDPESEASAQVSRLINKEAERSSLEAERQALARSLEELHREAASRRPDEPNPYRRLLAFPTLLRNQAAAQLLSTLNAVENERTQLLTRRTEADPDVQMLSARVAELEDQLRSLAVTYLTGLTNQVTSIDATLGGFSRQLEQIPRKQVQYARLARRTKGLEEAYNLLQTRLKESEIAQAINDASVQVVDTAQTPGWPSRPKPQVNLIGGLLVGLMLGVAGALLREHLDRSVHTRRDVMSATGLPVMGLIPHVTAGRRARVSVISEHGAAEHGPGTDEAALRPAASRQNYTFLNPSTPGSPPPESDRPEVTPPSEPTRSLAHRPRASQSSQHQRGWRLVASGSGSPAAEAYGTLQTNIAFARRDIDVKTLVLTSALPGDGKSTCAVNLALTLAHRGLRTLLIDADMRRGAIHSAFNVPRSPGLSDMLNGRVAVEDVIQEVDVGSLGATLHFITCGAATASPYSLVDSVRMRQALPQLAGQFDRVVIDTPPINVVTDAALLGALADGVLLVARAGVTEAAALSYALDQLRHVQAPVLGVVLNDVDFRRDEVYDRSYKYYTEDYAGQPAGS